MIEKIAEHENAVIEPREGINQINLQPNIPIVPDEGMEMIISTMDGSEVIIRDNNGHVREYNSFSIKGSLSFNNEVSILSASGAGLHVEQIPVEPLGEDMPDAQPFDV